MAGDFSQNNEYGISTFAMFLKETSQKKLPAHLGQLTPTAKGTAADREHDWKSCSCFYPKTPF